MKTIDANIIRQIFILLLIVLIGGSIFEQMLPYFSGILGAVTLYVLMRKTMAKLVNKGWRSNLAAIALIALSFLIILLPITGIVAMLSNKIGSAVGISEKVILAVEAQLVQWERNYGYNLSSQVDTRAISSWLSENLQSLAGSTFTSLITIGIMYFLLFYMLTNRAKFKASLFEYIPIGKESLKIIGKETREMVRANALGIPLVAVAQGIVALIGFLIFGVNNPFFWAVIVTFGSMLPFIGSLLGTVPVFVLMLSNGDTAQAWGILIYGIVVVGSTDNVIRLFVLQKLDNVHPLITLIGVVVGLPLFGFVGLIFGPLLISLFLIIVRIYKSEYGKKDTNKL